MSKYLFCDVETTGIDPNKNGIIQISGMIEIDGEIKEEFDIRVKPFEGQMISKEAMEINGVRLEDIRSYPEPIECHSKLIHVFEKYVSRYDKTDKFVFVGYNSNFDDTFLRAFFKNCGDDYYGSYIWWPTIDIAPFAMEFLKEKRHEMPNFKLETVAKAFGINVDETRLHEAMYDTILTRQLYKKMILGE